MAVSVALAETGAPWGGRSTKTVISVPLLTMNPPPIPNAKDLPQMEPPPPPKGFPHLAAKISWINAIIAIGAIAFGAWSHRPFLFYVGAMGAVIALFMGFCLAIAALCGLRKYGKKGVLAPALVGLVVDLILFPVALGILVPARGALFQVHASGDSGAAAHASKNYLDAEQSHILGSRVVIESKARGSNWEVVFEDDGRCGYLYAVDASKGDNAVLDTLLIYEAPSVKDKEAVSLSLMWREDGMAAAVLVNGHAQGVFNFASNHGYSRLDGVPPNKAWTAFTHHWEDTALNPFKPPGATSAKATPLPN